MYSAARWIVGTASPRWRCFNLSAVTSLVLLACCDAELLRGEVRVQRREVDRQHPPLPHLRRQLLLQRLQRRTAIVVCSRNSRDDAQTFAEYQVAHLFVLDMARNAICPLDFCNVTPRTVKELELQAYIALALKLVVADTRTAVLTLCKNFRRGRLPGPRSHHLGNAQDLCSAAGLSETCIRTGGRGHATKREGA